MCHCCNQRLPIAGTNKHQSAVTCLQFNKKFVITSSDDGTVKVWDLRTGEFLRNLVALNSGGSGGVVWRIKCSNTKLVCAVGSRNGTEETKLLVLDFDVEESQSGTSFIVPVRPAYWIECSGRTGCHKSAAEWLTGLPYPGSVFYLLFQLT